MHWKTLNSIQLRSRSPVFKIPLRHPNHYSMKLLLDHFCSGRRLLWMTAWFCYACFRYLVTVRCFSLPHSLPEFYRILRFAYCPRRMSNKISFMLNVLCIHRRLTRFPRFRITDTYQLPSSDFRMETVKTNLFITNLITDDYCM